MKLLGIIRTLNQGHSDPLVNQLETVHTFALAEHNF